MSIEAALNRKLYELFGIGDQGASSAFGLEKPDGSGAYDAHLFRELRQATYRRGVRHPQGEISLDIVNPAAQEIFVTKMQSLSTPEQQPAVTALCARVADVTSRITRSPSGKLIHPEPRLRLLSDTLYKLQQELQALHATELAACADAAAKEERERIQLQQLQVFSAYAAEQKKLLCHAMLLSPAGRRASAIARLTDLVVPSEKARLLNIPVGEKSLDGAEVVSGETGKLTQDHLKHLKSFYDKQTKKHFKVNPDGSLEFNVVDLSGSDLDRIVDIVLCHAEVQGWTTLNKIESKNAVFAKKLYLEACKRGLITDQHANVNIFTHGVNPNDTKDTLGFNKTIAMGEQLRKQYRELMNHPAEDLRQHVGDSSRLSSFAGKFDIRGLYRKHSDESQEFANAYQESLNLQRHEAEEEDAESDLEVSPSPTTT